MACFRCIIINTLHKSDEEDDDDDVCVSNNDIKLDLQDA